MSTGEVLRVRAAMKPISTVPRALADDRRGRPASRPRRSTSAATCAPCRQRESSRRPWSRSSSPTPSLEKFGGDSVEETRRNVEGYLKALIVP